jgi:hypothetical protein
MTDEQPRHVFISYVRENQKLVDRLCQDLKSLGVKIWLDRNDITPGIFWEDAIQNAIRDGAFFIACFSEEYNKRISTHMNEELNLAIEILRKRRRGQVWFIPVVLSGDVPDWEIFPGRTLQSIQWVPLYEDWDAGIQRILSVITPRKASDTLESSGFEAKAAMAAPPEEIKNHFFQKAWIFIIKQPLYLKITFCLTVVVFLLLCSRLNLFLKITFCLTVVVFLLLCSRLNLFGNPYYRYSKIIIPIHLPVVDAAPMIISLIFNYEIENTKGRRRRGLLGDNLYSGDRVFLSFKSNSDCWVSVFGVDSKRTFPLWPSRKKFFTGKIKKNSDYVETFILNQTIGNEIYYIVASQKKFNFNKSIRPHLDKLFPQGNSKGPAFSKYQLALSDEFVQRHIYFSHLF